MHPPEPHRRGGEGAAWDDQDPEDPEDRQELLRELPGFLERLAEQSHEPSPLPAGAGLPEQECEPAQASIDLLKRLGEALVADDELRERLCGRPGDNLLEQLRPVFRGSFDLVRGVARRWRLGAQPGSPRHSADGDGGGDPAEDAEDLIQLRLCAQLWRLAQVACSHHASAAAVVAASAAAGVSVQAPLAGDPCLTPSSAAEDALGEAAAVAADASLLDLLLGALVELCRGLLVRPEAPAGSLLLRAGFRLVCNVSAHCFDPVDRPLLDGVGSGSPDPAAALWEALWKPAGPPPSQSTLDELVVACQESGPLEPLSSFLCHILYNCVRKQPGWAHRLLSEGPLILLASRSELYFAGASDADDSGSDDDGDRADGYRTSIRPDCWLELLAGLMLCRTPCFIGAILGDRVPSGAVATPPAASDETQPQGARDYAEGCPDTSQLLTRLGVCEYLLDFFRPVRLAKGEAAGEPAAVVSGRETIFSNASRLVRFLAADPDVSRRRGPSFRAVMARFFGELASLYANHPNLLARLAEAGLGNVAAHWLDSPVERPDRGQESSTPPLAAAAAEDEHKQRTEDPAEHPFFFTSTIKLVANLSTHPLFKTQFVEAGGLERMLSRTHIDERNPLTREWAVFAIRNLTAGDPELQARVARLQPQAVERRAEEQLRRMGLEPRFSESGKLVVERAERAQGPAPPPDHPPSEE